MRTKTFDCVEMKRNIQRRIEEEFAGLTSHEQRDWTERRILDDLVLGPIWRAKTKQPSAPSDTLPTNRP